ncbi:hypothetical protein GCM10009119_33260 [Algoriphagus jejuensis]|uniref:Aerotolerance regulator N-terminal domain-containing protein n=1 Tax=Algoriphagus jejuensis TaxID=419934 RepID=A0ABN1N430_9BACT
MEWIQPAFFWALLGISVPLAIHFWNGRKGKVIAWAATAWLNPQESQSSKSFRLDQWLLLLVRILLWILLVLLAVGLWWKSSGPSDSPKIVHLLVPNSQVESEFRFELEQALERGEDVFWLAEDLPDYELGESPEVGFQSENVQEYLNLLPQTLDSLHLYSSGMEVEIPQAMLWVPVKPEVHLATQLSPPVFSKKVIKLESGSYLGLNEAGALISIPVEAAFSADLIAFSGAIPLYFSLSDSDKKANLQAALTALTTVYGLTFEEVSGQDAKVVFADQAMEESEDGKLYFYTPATEIPKSKLQISLGNSVTLPWEEAIDKGILPELILTPMVEYLGISPKEVRMSKRNFEQKFVEIPKAKQSVAANTTELFLVLIVLVFGLERFLAYRNNL